MTYDSREATRDLQELSATLSEMRECTRKVAKAVARKLIEKPSIKAPRQERDHVLRTLVEIEREFRYAADDVEEIRKAIETIGHV